MTTPMEPEELRCWRYIVQHQTATAEQVARDCLVPVGYAQSLIDRIGTPLAVREKAELERTQEKVGTMSVQHGGTHYKNMAIQPWEALAAWLTPEEHRGYHKGVAIGYLARERQKGGSEDIRKAIHHLERLLEVEGADQ